MELIFGNKRNNEHFAIKILLFLVTFSREIYYKTRFRHRLSRNVHQY